MRGGRVKPVPYSTIATTKKADKTNVKELRCMKKIKKKKADKFRNTPNAFNPSQEIQREKPSPQKRAKMRNGLT